MTPPVPRLKLKATPTLLYLIVFLVICGLIGSLSLLAQPTNVQWAYLMAQGLFLVVGFLNVQPMRRFLPFAQAGDVWTGVLLSTGLMLLGGLIVGLIPRFVAGREADWGFATAIIPFIIGYFFYLTLDYYLRIPSATYKKWYYPLNDVSPDMDLIDLSRVLVIQFEFPKRADESGLTNFKAKAPVAMNLGELFLVFINDYNERNPNGPVVYLDAQQIPYGWLFYKKHAWWKRRRHLDPDRTFQQNGIADNDTIRAERGQ
ncbi:MAG: TssN family type VI secretion system protein [Cytophagaceae bacterium]|nr:TssN family type VI secretion system protein [Cytophagaceae bacterium]